MFPPEIYELIFDELGSEESEVGTTKSLDARKALRSCLFVSWSFRHHARRHLFSKIRIDQGLGESSGGILTKRSLLHDVLNPKTMDSPSILSYIHHISIRFSSSGLPYSDTDLRPLAIRTMKITAGILEVLSSRLCSVRSLVLDGQNGEHMAMESMNVSWTFLGPSIRQSITALCRSPHLEQLSMMGINDLPIGILSGSSVKTLFIDELRPFTASTSIFHLGDLSPSTIESDLSTLFPEYSWDHSCMTLPHLDSLIAKTVPDFYTWVYPPNTSTNISRLPKKSLDICIFSCNGFHETCQPIVDNCLTLESMSIRIYDIVGADGYSFFNVPPLPQDSLKNQRSYMTRLTNLRQLSFSVENGGHWHITRSHENPWSLSFPAHISTMASILSFCSNPSVSSIAIEFRDPDAFMIDLDDDGVVRTADLRPLTELDDLLASSATFPSLLDFNLAFMIQENTIERLGLGSLEENKISFAKVVQDAFPSLTSSRKLTLGISFV